MFLRSSSSSDQSAKSASRRSRTELRWRCPSALHRGRPIRRFPAGQPNTCNDGVLPPTDFETEFRQGNMRFRIPLQMFGLGIIDGIQDREILDRHNGNGRTAQGAGHGGTPNRSGNDGTITGSAGRRRTSPSPSSPPKPTTWRWASPTTSSPRPPTRSRLHR